MFLMQRIMEEVDFLALFENHDDHSNVKLLSEKTILEKVIKFGFTSICLEINSNETADSMLEKAGEGFEQLRKYILPLIINDVSQLIDESNYNREQFSTPNEEIRFLLLKLMKVDTKFKVDFDIAIAIEMLENGYFASLISRKLISKEKAEAFKTFYRCYYWINFLKNLKAYAHKISVFCIDQSECLETGEVLGDEKRSEHIIQNVINVASSCAGKSLLIIGLAHVNDVISAAKVLYELHAKKSYGLSFYSTAFEKNMDEKTTFSYFKEARDSLPKDEEGFKLPLRFVPFEDFCLHMRETDDIQNIIEKYKTEDFKLAFRRAAHLGELRDMQIIFKLVGEEVVDAAGASSGNTALHVASQRNHYAICEYLISIGADKGKLNAFSQTPADLCTPGSRVENLLTLESAQDVSASASETRPETVANKR